VYLELGILHIRSLRRVCGIYRTLGGADDRFVHIPTEWGTAKFGSSGIWIAETIDVAGGTRVAIRG